MSIIWVIVWQNFMNFNFAAGAGSKVNVHFAWPLVYLFVLNFQIAKWIICDNKSFYLT